MTRVAPTTKTDEASWGNDNLGSSTIGASQGKGEAIAAFEILGPSPRGGVCECTKPSATAHPHR
jgi:hypothetical protein